MKYVVIVGDGMPDYPLEELGGKTPLQVAITKNMDTVASKGLCGMVNFVPEEFAPGSDVANLSVFGYDPKKCYTGRGPLEAASMGVELNEGEIAFRCNLVTIKNNIMEDYSCGHIGTAEAKELIEEIDKKLSDEKIKFHPGISYRHLCVIKNGPRNASCTPPHDITGKNISDYLPKGPGANLLNDLTLRSMPILNSKRKDSSIWLWGQGKKPSIQTYKEKFGLSGSVITAVDLIKGIGIYAGLDIINVPGATGYLDTNYKGKADYAINSLSVKDFVFVHVEAPDEAGHNGKARDKIKAIEDFDNLVVGNILKGIKQFKEWRLLITSDHMTPTATKTHARGMVPFALMGAGINSNGIRFFDEVSASKSDIKLENGHSLLSEIQKEKCVLC